MKPTTCIKCGAYCYAVVCDDCLEDEERVAKRDAMLEDMWEEERGSDDL